MALCVRTGQMQFLFVVCSLHLYHLCQHVFHTVILDIIYMFKCIFGTFWPVLCGLAVNATQIKLFQTLQNRVGREDFAVKFFFFMSEDSIIPECQLVQASRIHSPWNWNACSSVKFSIFKSYGVMYLKIKKKDSWHSIFFKEDQ